MEVKVVISTETAIEEGHAQAGTFKLQITDEFVADLNDAEREELICLVRNSTDASLWGGAGLSIPCKNIERPSLPALKSLIQRRIVARDAAKLARDEADAREKAKREADTIDTIRAWIAKDAAAVVRAGGRVVVTTPNLYHGVPEAIRAEYEAHHAHLQSIADDRNTEIARENADRDTCERREAAEQKQEIKAWIAEHGSVSMNEREAERLLPEKELLNAVREWLFEPLERFSRYVRLTKADALHDDDCWDKGPCAYITDDADELSADEFSRLGEIRKVAATLAEPAEVQAREHRVWCQRKGGCPHVTMRRAVKVTVSWKGAYTLSREYALTAQGEDAFYTSQSSEDSIYG